MRTGAVELAVERDCCAQLTALVAEERAAVVARDLAELARIGVERERLQARWARALRERRAAGAATESAAGRELDQAARELQRAQRVNHAVIGGLLRSLDEILARTRLHSLGGRYDARAAACAPPTRSSLEWRA